MRDGSVCPLVKRLAIVALLVLAACARDRGEPRLESKWQYALTEPRAEPPDDSAPWSENVDGDARHDVWVRGRAPRSEPTFVVLRAYVAELTLFVDRTPVFSYRQPSQVGRLTLHSVALPPGSAGKRIYMRVPRAPREAFFGAAPLLATDDTLAAALDRAAIEPMRLNGRDMVIALVLIIAGAAATGASMLRRRGDSRTLFWFGVFTFLYGLRLAFDSFLPILFGVPLRTNAFAVAFITYAITAPAWAVAVRLIGPGWKSTMRWQVVAFALFAPIGIVSDLVTGRPGSLETVNNVLVIIGGVVVLANSIRLRGRTTLELRVVLGGAVVFLLFALNNNLAALHLLPWHGVDETIGFVLFVACLGFAAMRSFLRGEREQIALENELRTAHEIQLSILPTSMPDVPGLAFHARYDPASSVAGDLYDFLRVDARHTGVLVADVSGHGVPAALIASMVKVAVSSSERLAGDPAALLASVDATLRRDVRRAFVTATYLWLDMDAHSVTVCNAGHPQPLLFRRHTERGDRFLELGTPGVLLGRFAGARYTAATTALEPGDRIVAYTDGVVEAMSTKRELFGEERLQTIVRESTALDVRAVADAIVAAVRGWRVEDEDADDLTVVVIDVE
jgi:phosphoserine phosphatase RsbU/P